MDPRLVPVLDNEPTPPGEYSSITCRACGTTSRETYDIRETWCAACAKHHVDMTDFDITYDRELTETEKRAEYEAWLAKRPEAIRALVRRCPPMQCYRMHANRGHYWIVSYSVNANGHATMTLAHGRDSYMPGVGVFGIRASAVKPCGCGKWEMPTAG